MQAAIKAAGVQRNSSLKNKHTLAVPLSVCETRRASNSSLPPPLPITQYDDEVLYKYWTALIQHRTKKQLGPSPLPGEGRGDLGQLDRLPLPRTVETQTEYIRQKKEGQGGGASFTTSSNPHKRKDSFSAFQGAALLMLPSILKQELETVS